MQPFDQGPTAVLVKVVAGFVQDEEIRVGQLGANQGHPHCLTAAEHAGRCDGIQMCETLLRQCLPKLLFYVPSIGDHVEIRLRGTAGLDALERIQHALHACQIGNGGVRAWADLLGEVMHCTCSHTAPTGGLQLARKNARQNGLAAAIASD